MKFLSCAVIIVMVFRYIGIDVNVIILHFQMCPPCNPAEETKPLFHIICTEIMLTFLLLSCCFLRRFRVPSKKRNRVLNGIKLFKNEFITCEQGC